jgi:hypothetical protein
VHKLLHLMLLEWLRPVRHAAWLSCGSSALRIRAGS